MAMTEKGIKPAAVIAKEAKKDAIAVTDQSQNTDKRCRTCLKNSHTTGR